MYQEKKADLKVCQESKAVMDEKTALRAVAREKTALRAAAREKRNGLDAKRRAEWSEAICRRLLEWSVFQTAKTVYFYYPLGSEADLLPAARALLESGKQVGFPRTSGEEMEFYPVRSLEEFQEGAFHVMEPAGEKPLREEQPLILAPGLAFDERKGRIGYGKAYYDRYFQRYPQACRAGICFETQMVAQIPREVHDCIMDYLVTEKRIIV